MRTSVHPDDQRRAVLPRTDGIGDRISLYRLSGVPDPDTEGSLHEVEHRQSLALPLDHRILGFVVGECPEASFLVQRDARIVHRHRVASQILVTSGAPRASHVRLCVGRSRHEGNCKQHQPEYVGAEYVGAGFSRPTPKNLHHIAVHGLGSHLEPSASFLKCELTIYGRCRYCGSSTTVVTISTCPPDGCGATSKYSVTVASALYGTPFRRRYPGRTFVVTTVSDPVPPRPPPGA